MSRKEKFLWLGLLIIHYVILYLILTRQLDFLFNDASHRIGPGSDFFALFNAGKHWLVGDGIYNQGPGYGFRYHPIFAMTILSYISRLGYDWGYGVWVGIQEICFLVTIFFTHKMVSDKRHFIIISFLLVFFSPYYLEVYMGNASFITGTLLLVSFYFYRQQDFKKFFIIFIISILIKPIGLLFLPLLFFDKQKKMVIAALVIIIGLALPYFLMYSGDWINFVHVNFDGYAVHPGFLVHAGNQGFYALLLTLSTHLHHLPNSKFYTLHQLPWWNDYLIRAIPYIFVLLSLWLTYHLRKSKQLELLIFLWIATYLLGYKDVWEHTYSLLVFGLLFLYLSKAINPRLLLICAVAIALPTAFVFYDITFFHGAFNDPDWHWGFTTSLIHHATKPIWVLVLYIAGMVKGFKKENLQHL